jgi:glycosyltransferase involved in cell wall biosynthesis
MSAHIESENGAVPKGTASFVFWDGYGLANQYSGVGFYAWKMHEALAKLRVNPNIIAPEQPFFGGDGVTVVSSQLPGKIAGSKLVWPRIAYAHAAKVLGRSDGRGVFHGLSNINVPWHADHRRLKTVVTVHDLTPLIAPNLVSKAYALQFSFAIRRIVRDVDAIVAVSDWTARTIREFFPKAAAKIRVIRNGRPQEFGGKSRPYVYREKSILTVSRFEPYKNLQMIGKMAELTGKELTFNVVTDRRAEHFFRSFHPRLLAEGRIRIHAETSGRTLEALYAKTDCYLQPSLYEGFCLPVLDAVARGIPVAFLKGSAVDEIALPAYASGAEKNTPDSFLEAIQSAVNKAQFPEFLENTKNSFLGFPTWDDAAKSLKSLYTELL